jgi:hypothetical protein
MGTKSKCISSWNDPATPSYIYECNGSVCSNYASGKNYFYSFLFLFSFLFSFFISFSFSFFHFIFFFSFLFLFFISFSFFHFFFFFHIHFLEQDGYPHNLPIYPDINAQMDRLIISDDSVEARHHVSIFSINFTLFSSLCNLLIFLIIFSFTSLSPFISLFYYYYFIFYILYFHSQSPHSHKNNFPISLTIFTFT